MKRARASILLGYVYIIEPLEYHIKIGISKQPTIRLNKLKLSSGMTPKRQWISKATMNYVEIEKYLHRLFAEHRRIGEYFSMSYEEAVSAAEDFCNGRAVDIDDLRKAYHRLIRARLYGEEDADAES